MTRAEARSPRVLRRWASIALSAPFVVLCLGGMILLTMDAARHIQSLATANSDSSQWSLAQIEVEFAALQRALDGDPDAADLDDLRQKFDIFYSRFMTIARGNLYRDVVSVGPSRDSMELVQTYLDAAVAAIDGPDATLRLAIPDIRVGAEAVRADLRQISLNGVRVFSRQSDAQRHAVMQALTRLAALAAALVMALAVGVLLLLRLVHIARDQARRRARANHRLQAVVSTALDAIVVTNGTGQILEFNAAAERIFGCSRLEALGAAADNVLFSNGWRDQHAGGLADCANQGLIRATGQRMDGRPFPVEFAVTQSERRGNTLRVIYLRDITNQEAAEHELMDARDKAVAGEQARAQFLAVMSHEMRTPLNGLIGTLELLGDTELDYTQSKYFNVLQRSADILLTHVNDVLDLSRLETGKFVFASDPYAPAELVSELVESFAPSAASRGTELGQILPERPRFGVLGDRTRVRQVLVNLLGNAIKFTDEGHITLELICDEGADYMVVRISDTGIGIPEEQISTIFEDFVTLDASYTRAAEGTGLGLGIARQLVEGMGGSLSVSSTEGRGSVFTVALPASPCVLPEEVDPQHPPPESPAIRILLVEDNPVNRLVASSLLGKLGHHVSEAFDGGKGLARAGEERFDLILMDISMPGLDGVETTRRIRVGTGPNAKTPIVALTAHALPGDLARFEAAGMNLSLTKPITRRALAKTIAGLSLSQASPGVSSDCLSRTGQAHFGTTRVLPATVIDAQILGAASDSLGTGAFGALRDRFVEETESGLADLAKHLAEGLSATDYAEKVHRLAGSAAVFGAAALHLALRGQETRARRESDTAKLAEHHAGLFQIWRVTRQALLAHAPG